MSVRPDPVPGVDFIEGNRLSSSRLLPVPGFLQVAERHIVKLIPPRIINHQKRNASLSLEGFHEPYLMLMDVLQAEGIRLAFLCIKADRNSLHGTDIVDGALLVEVGECYMPCLLQDKGGL